MSGGILVVGSLNMDMSVRVAAMPAGRRDCFRKISFLSDGRKGS